MQSWPAWACVLLVGGWWIFYMPIHVNPEAYGVRSVMRPIRRLRDVRTFLQHRTTVPVIANSENFSSSDAWENIDAAWPDVTDRRTLKILARLSCWAYYEHVPTKITDAPDLHWSGKFGWQSEGLRGQVFATEKDRLVIVALKGTSASFLPGGETGQKDKDNDNLLFSCCCARVTNAWKPVCDCYQGKNQCDTECLSRALLENSLYYPAATDLYNNISYMYPNSQIWVTGHSLGGVMASLLGATFGVPAVAFESPGDRMAAARLHVPIPPANTPNDDAYALVPVTHVYHTADSLATGQCVGPTSICSRTGFAMESKCHLGQSIVYDTVQYLGWSIGIMAHRITYVMSELLSEDWDRRVLRDSSIWTHLWPSTKGLKAVPDVQRESLCQDCTSWTFT